MNIFVGNLSRQATEEDLRQAFSSFGNVAKATIIKDKFSGEPRGFGFVEMATKEEAMAAIAGMNGKELLGRTLNVNEARPREAGGGGGGSRGGGGGGDRRGGGGGRGGFGERRDYGGGRRNG
ncbi:MAG: RNA-binding protein [bacterium]|jgi:RNA recognition motif-containing protein|nr:RNA-binding protein [bacterium]